MKGDWKTKGTKLKAGCSWAARQRADIDHEARRSLLAVWSSASQLQTQSLCTS